MHCREAGRKIVLLSSVICGFSCHITLSSVQYLLPTERTLPTWRIPQHDFRICEVFHDCKFLGCRVTLQTMLHRVHGWLRPSPGWTWRNLCFLGASDKPFDKCGWEYMFKQPVLTFINVFCVVTLSCSFVLDIYLIRQLHKRTHNQVTAKVSWSQILRIVQVMQMGGFVTLSFSIVGATWHQSSPNNIGLWNEQGNVGITFFQADDTRKMEQLRRVTSMIITVITVHCCINLPWLITVNLPISHLDIYFFIVTPFILLSKFFPEKHSIHDRFLVKWKGIICKEAHREIRPTHVRWLFGTSKEKPQTWILPEYDRSENAPTIKKACACKKTSMCKDESWFQSDTKTEEAKQIRETFGKRRELRIWHQNVRLRSGF